MLKNKMKLRKANTSVKKGSNDEEKVNLTNELIKSNKELERKKKLELLMEAKEILPDKNDDSIAKAVDKQMTDEWTLICTQFQRQLEATKDLRVDIAESSVYEIQENDHSSVKFLKSLFNEWRISLNMLSDEELNKKKYELSNMWYCLFALQPLFDGYNNDTLCKEIAIGVNRIVEELKKNNMDEADQAYFDLSIGNNIWPVGITQFSIHWKFSVDIIAAEKVLHIFNNECSRNAIKAVRSLMNKYKELHKRKI